MMPKIPPTAHRHYLRIFSGTMAVILGVIVLFFIVRFSDSRSVDRRFSLTGSVTEIGVKGGRTVTNVTFDHGEVSETLPVASMNIVLIPDVNDISDGAPLSLSLSAGKRIFGYKYSSRDAAAEIAAKERADNGEPLTYSELFPGQFFASHAEQNGDTFIASFETQKNIAFLPLSAVTLEKNSRYVIIASDTGTTLKVRNVPWCPNGTREGSEECDDNNIVDNDTCTNTCKITRCSDGTVQSPNGQGITEQCDDGNIFDTDLCTNTCRISCGNGIFAPLQEYLAGDNPPFPISFTSLDNTLAFGDLNGDGITDKVTANINVTTTRTISVYIGYGNDRYYAPTDLSLDIHTPSAVAIGDLNGDAKKDIAVSHGPNNSITVFWGNGLGGFTVHRNRFPTDKKPESITIADVNGDSINDILTGNQGYYGQAGGKSISVILGTGLGVFLPAVQYPTTYIPTNVFSRDLNNDGITDLLTLNIGNSASVLLGTGQGTFLAPTLYRTISFPDAVAMGDFNGDGNMDLATRRLNIGVDAGIAVLLGKVVGSCN